MRRIFHADLADNANFYSVQRFTQIKKICLNLPDLREKKLEATEKNNRKE